MTSRFPIDVAELLTRYGQRVSDEMRDAAPEASGGLKNSIEHEVTISGPIVELTISAAAHAKYVELGRRPGKFPPVDAIRRWCETKGIDSRAAFPIARSIAKNGIKPRPFIETTTKRTEDDISKEISRLAGQQVKVQFEQMIQRIFNQR